MLAPAFPVDLKLLLSDNGSVAPSPDELANAQWSALGPNKLHSAEFDAIIPYASDSHNISVYSHVRLITDLRLLIYVNSGFVTF